MKIFYYNRNSGNYEWDEVNLDKTDFSYGRVTTKGDFKVNEDEIYKIIGDVRKPKDDPYVMCGYCKKIVRLSQLEKHYAKRESKDCLKCKYFNKSQVITDAMNRIVRNENGTITASQRITFTPYCDDTYRSCEEARETKRCRYVKCRTYRHLDLPKSLLTEYPKLRQGKIITASKLLDNGFRLTSPNGTAYKYKNTNLYAYADSKGIVSKFMYEGKYGCACFYYSSVYDKIFGIDCRRYVVNNLTQCTTIERAEFCEKIVRNLYK